MLRFARSGVTAVLDEVRLPRELADAAADDSWDSEIRAETDEAVRTLADRPGFAELKRNLRAFPNTPLSSRIAHRSTQVG